MNSSGHDAPPSPRDYSNALDYFRAIKARAKAMADKRIEAERLKPREPETTQS